MRFLSRIAQRPPHPVHRHIKTVLEIYVPAIAPDDGAKLLARNNVSRTLQQSEKNLKRLAGKSNKDAALEQFTGIPIDFERAEDNSVSVLRLREHQICEPLCAQRMG
jgi:hypothetical protein